MQSTSIVPLPAIWQPYLAQHPGHRGDTCPGGTCLPAARAVRKVRVAAADGRVRQVMVFAEHGVERYLPFALFVDELRRQQPHRAAAAAAVRPAVPSLYFVPYVVQLPDTNASKRAALHAALSEATLRSVRAHPAAPGRAPNHFIVVPRVCSCPWRTMPMAGVTRHTPARTRRTHPPSPSPQLITLTLPLTLALTCALPLSFTLTHPLTLTPTLPFTLSPLTFTTRQWDEALRHDSHQVLRRQQRRAECGGGLCTQ